MVNNTKTSMDLQLSYYELEAVLRAKMMSAVYLNGYIDIFLRIAIISLTVGIAVYLIHATLLQSNQVTDIIMRISSTNVQMYSNHFNKLSVTIENEADYDTLLEETSAHYRNLFKYKLEKEKRNVLNKRVLIATLSWSSIGKKALQAVLIITAFIAIQLAKPIVSRLSNSDLAYSLDSNSGLCNTVSSYAAIDTITVRLSTLVLEGKSKSDEFQMNLLQLEKYLKKIKSDEPFLDGYLLLSKTQALEDLLKKLFTTDLCVSLNGSRC